MDVSGNNVPGYLCRYTFLKLAMIFPAMFVCLGFIVPLENISLLWICHHCRWRAANFYLCSALMAIEQWGFLSVPNLLWHGVSVYNGHLRGPVTLTPIAERLAVDLSPPVLTTVFRGWDSNSQPSACEENALTNSATTGRGSLRMLRKTLYRDNKDIYR